MAVTRFTKPLFKCPGCPHYVQSTHSVAFFCGARVIVSLDDA